MLYESAYIHHCVDQMRPDHVQLKFLQFQHDLWMGSNELYQISSLREPTIRKFPDSISDILYLENAQFVRYIRKKV